jgi:hypothetical protein
MRFFTAISRRAVSRVAVLSALAGSAFALVACGEIVERVPDRPKQDRATAANFVLDVDPIMRGTVASETVVEGLRPVIVRGYGLVVGLQGTGGRLMPAEVRAMMVQELARRGIGNPVLSADLSPEEMLNSPDTAVVIVEGVRAAGRHADLGAQRMQPRRGGAAAAMGEYSPRQAAPKPAFRA